MPTPATEGPSTAPAEIAVRLVSSAELPEIHAELLAPAFPPTELEPAASLAERMITDGVEVRVAEQAGLPVAVAVTEPLPPSRGWLLTYFATHPERRGGGIGGTTLTAVITQLVAAHRPSMIIGEVEHPAHHGSDPDHGDPTARLRFYGRYGARLLDLPYFQPSIGPGLAPVYGMALIVLYADPAIDASTMITDGAELHALMTAMVAEGAVGPDTEIVADILTRAADPAGTRLLPLAAIDTLPVILTPSAR